MISRLIVAVADFYVALILIYVVLSWFPNHDRGAVGTVYAALATLCEPYLKLFRNLIPPAGGLDFSPVIAIVVLQLVVRLIVFLL